MKIIKINLRNFFVKIGKKMNKILSNGKPRPFDKGYTYKLNVYDICYPVIEHRGEDVRHEAVCNRGISLFFKGSDYSYITVPPGHYFELMVRDDYDPHGGFIPYDEDKVETDYNRLVNVIENILKTKFIEEKDAVTLSEIAKKYDYKKEYIVSDGGHIKLEDGYIYYLEVGETCYITLSKSYSNTEGDNIYQSLLVYGITSDYNGDLYNYIIIPKGIHFRIERKEK